MDPGEAIIITWSDDSGMEPTGRTVWRDGYQRPEIRSCRVAKALVWSRSVTDWDGGEAFAKKIGGTCRPMADTDDVLEEARGLESAGWPR